MIDMRIEHVVFIVFGIVFVVFIGCACYHKIYSKNYK